MIEIITNGKKLELYDNYSARITAATTASDIDTIYNAAIAELEGGAE